MENSTSKRRYFPGGLPEQFGDFVQTIIPVEHEFDVYYIANKLICEVESALAKFDLEILGELPDDLEDFAKRHNFVLADDEIFLEVKDTRHYDCISAREHADRRLDMLQDLFTLFHHKEQIGWQDRTLIRQYCVDSPQMISSTGNAMQRSFDLRADKASQQLNWLLENIALWRDGGFQKFSRIVDLHGICVTNDVPENQLLNLWIALETLVPSSVKRNKVNNIVRSIDPFVRLTYVKRLIDRAVFDLVSWNQQYARKFLSKIPDAKKQPIQIKIKMLRLLADPANEGVRSELYAALLDYHLLRYRIFRLSETFSSPEKLATLIDAHSQRVEWELRRLYRTRNLIVHTGRTPKYIGALIENGHEYLDLVLEEIMELTCGEYNVPSLEQVFEIERLHIQRYEATLHAADTFSGADCDFLYRQHVRRED
ncbi:hypothetical protein [Woeseia oceani]|uniref:Apea-like HEPN domain-containing protein n=1 Tax=Woeseia oceani TaxID=1548547 RepID=A0A193LD48_9GAMM|nr:hypothetical protein [Woeseia oceani]ANO50437.1 hypothetical protein BA177_03740 [Woeseia oceani]